MELKPTKAQILWLAEKYNTVPLSTTLPATVTPTQVLQKLKTVSRHCYMLESCEDKESSGRYTFLGFDPQAEIHCKDGKGTVMDENGSRTFTGSPKPHIAALLERHKSPRLRELPTFTGGLVGYFAYDYAKYSEPRLELTAAEDGNFNDVDLMLFDKVIAFDHLRQKLILMVNMSLDEPELIRHGSKYGVKIHAQAPSINLIKARIETEIAPIVGNEQQAKDLIAYIKDGEATEDGVWDTNIFGKSVEQIVEDGMQAKISQMTEDCQMKLQDTLQKIINDSNGGMICIII